MTDCLYIKGNYTEFRIIPSTRMSTILGQNHSKTNWINIVDYVKVSCFTYVRMKSGAAESKRPKKEKAE